MTNGKTKEQFVVGLDIGTTKVCCVVAKKDEFGKIHVLGVGKSKSEGLQRATVVNINRTVDAIREAVNEASHTSSIKIKGVNVGISGEHVQCIKSSAEITINPTQIVNHNDVMRLVEKAKKKFRAFEYGAACYSLYSTRVHRRRPRRRFRPDWHGRANDARKCLCGDGHD